MDAEVVGAEALFASVLRVEAPLKPSEKDAGVGSGGGVLQLLQERLQGGVGGIARPLAFLQKTLDLHRDRHLPKRER